MDQQITMDLMTQDAQIATFIANDDVVTNLLPFA
jgi:hypothetical protein